MKRLLVFDQRVDGEPPWKRYDRTLLVNATHSLSSILAWLKARTQGYAGKEALGIIAHGAEGCVDLGSDGLDNYNVEKWAVLRDRFSEIRLIACPVSNVKPGQFVNPTGWGNGFVLCSRLASYTKALATAADSTQRYERRTGSDEVDVGSWEGIVYQWDSHGHCCNVWWES